MFVSYFVSIGMGGVGAAARLQGMFKDRWAGLVFQGCGLPHVPSKGFRHDRLV